MQVLLAQYAYASLSLRDLMSSTPMHKYIEGVMSKEEVLATVLPVTHTSKVTQSCD